MTLCVDCHEREPVAHGRCMRCYKRRVGDPDGFGIYGVLDVTEDGVLCHECGLRFRSVGAHVYMAHEMTAAEYREAHGLPRMQALISPEVAARLSEIATERIDTPAWHRLEAARDPAAAAAARDMATQAPAVREARTAANLPKRAPKQHTCRWCGATYTGKLRDSCRKPECRALAKSDQGRRSAATLHPPLPAETADLLRRATGDAQASMIRRLQREGYSSAAIGRAIGRGSPWMTKNFPRK